MNIRNLDLIQRTILAAGTIFAWYSVGVDTIRFYQTEGTLFKLSDCVYPNPITTPCLWGAVLFLVLLVLALRMRLDAPTLRKQKWILGLTAFGTLFAWANFSVTSWKFFAAPTGTGTSCSGVHVATPFVTPCFFGALFFTASLVAACLYFRVLDKNKK